MLPSTLLEFHWGESEIVNEFIGRAAQQCFREALVMVIKARQPAALTLDVQWAIAQETNLGQLRQWIDAAAMAQGAEPLVATLLERYRAR